MAVNWIERAQKMAQAARAGVAVERKRLQEILDEEDEETLAAIDEGIRDAKAARTVPDDEVRKRLPAD